MREDVSRAVDAAHVGAAVADHEPARWRCNWRLEKRWGDDQSVDPYEVIEREGNLLLYGGASLIWETLIGNGGAGALQYLNSGHAFLGVGDSSTAEAATQTDLQAATNKTYKAATPSHTDGTSSGNASITYSATFATGDANYTWSEWLLTNAASGGRALNRKVAALGVKTSAASWALSVTITLS